MHTCSTKYIMYTDSNAKEFILRSQKYENCSVKLQPIGNSCHNNCTISDSNQLSKFNNPTLTLTQTNTPFPELQNHALHSFPSSTSSNQSNISKEKTISKPLSKITCPTRLLILHPWSQPLGSQLGEEMHCFLKP